MHPIPTNLPRDGVEFLLVVVTESLAGLNDNWGESQNNHSKGKLGCDLGCVGVVVVGVSKMVLQAVDRALSLQQKHDVAYEGAKVMCIRSSREDVL